MTYIQGEIIFAVTACLMGLSVLLAGIFGFISGYKNSNDNKLLDGLIRGFGWFFLALMASLYTYSFSEKDFGCVIGRLRSKNTPSSL